jgi:2,3-bisphosphoglycerate-independent phosphoglycerate mutase
LKNLKLSPPVALVIIDGLGLSKKIYGNAIASADMVTFKTLSQKYPYIPLQASGEAVGLPDGFMGNSEVGHLTIGAGRVVPSILKQCHQAIDNKSFFKNETLVKNFSQLEQTQNSLHLVGLLSDGGVHSHKKHLYSLIELASTFKMKNIFLHLFLDGRDVGKQSAACYLEKLQKIIDVYNNIIIVSVHGRFYAMDRDNNWDRTKLSYDVLIDKKLAITDSWQQIIKQYYEKNITDEFIEPTLIFKEGIIQEGDGIVFFNFRPDRMQQLARCFLDPSLSEFQHKNLNLLQKKLNFVICMASFSNDFKKLGAQSLFETQEITDTLPEVLSSTLPSHKKTMYIAETEKYAHITYFLDGMRTIEHNNQQKILIPSIKVKTYVSLPGMQAPTITDHLLNHLENEEIFFFVVNYANLDMVGHSGDFEATIQACKIIDECLKKLYNKIVIQQKGSLIIISDHGNAEEMIDEKGSPITSHSRNPVPFIICNDSFKGKQFNENNLAGLSVIAPTILELLEIPIPREMEKPLSFVF